MRGWTIYAAGAGLMRITSAPLIGLHTRSPDSIFYFELFTELCKRL